MAAFKLNIKLDQGATNRKLVTWKTGDPALPVDLTGCTATAQLRSTVTSTEVLGTLSTALGTIILGGNTGTVELIFKPELTIGVSWRSAVYDMEITFPNTDITRLLEGAIALSPEVTRV